MICMFHRTCGKPIAALWRVLPCILAVIAFLAFPIEAHADNETEMTGGFNPVVLNSGEDSDAAGAAGAGNAADAAEPERQANTDGSSSETGLQDEVATESQPSSSTSSQPGSKSPGIRLDDGSVVSVDEGGNLVLVDPSGAVRTIDDSHRYTVEEHGGGAVIIRGDDGVEVDVRGSSVSFTDADGGQVVVDATSGDASDGQAATTSSGMSASGAATSGEGETELSDESEVATQDQGISYVPFAVGGVIVAAAVAGLAFWRLKRRNR